MLDYLYPSKQDTCQLGKVGNHLSCELLSFTEKDEPPLSKAGRDVVLRLPADEVTLDGRESTDDHAIVRYEWALLQGDPSVDMKVIVVFLHCHEN